MLGKSFYHGRERSGKYIKNKRDPYSVEIAASPRRVLISFQQVC